MMTHDEMIAVIKHHRDGGKVQHRYHDHETWDDTFAPGWNFYENDYRPKPEPIVVYVEVSNVTHQPLRVGLSSDMTCDYTNTTIKKFIESHESD